MAVLGTMTKTDAYTIPDSTIAREMREPAGSHIVIVMSYPAMAASWGSFVTVTVFL